MKNSVLLILLMTSVSWAQELSFKGAMSRDFKKAKKFNVIDSLNNEKIIFKRVKKNKLIIHGADTLILNKRKILLKDNEVLMTVINNKKIELSNGKIISVKKNKNGWTYVLGNKQILEISYVYNKNEGNYLLHARSNESSDVVFNLMQLNLGRIDRKLEMDNDFDDVLWGFIESFGLIVSSILQSY